MSLAVEPIAEPFGTPALFVMLSVLLVGTAFIVPGEYGDCDGLGEGDGIHAIILARSLTRFS